MSYQGHGQTGYHNPSYNQPLVQAQPVFSSSQQGGTPQHQNASSSYPSQQYPSPGVYESYQHDYQPHQGYEPNQPPHVNINVGAGPTLLAPSFSSPAFLRAQSIMLNEFCGCFEDCGICLLTFCVGSPCTFGLAYEASGQGSCLAGCCCYPCLCCSSRNRIQQMARVPQDGCLMACMIHYFCSGCASIQEYRAAKSLQEITMQ